MPVRFLALAITAYLLLFPLQPAWSVERNARKITIEEQQDLPVALNTYLFEDLPFEQRRQALREEIEGRQRQPGTSY